MSKANHPSVPLIEELGVAWRSAGLMDDVLKQFVVEVDARASGCWRLVDGELLLAGFGWASDMPDEVSQGFQDATRRVSLEETGLGIVKAAISQRPAVGYRDPGESGLTGSASWIAKFAAESSLAVPICRPLSNAVVGVFAVSTANRLEEGDTLWENMVRIAQSLGSGR